MTSVIAWVIISLLAATILLALWCCLAINTPRTEGGKRRAFHEDCMAFDAYMARKKGGESHAE